MSGDRLRIVVAGLAGLYPIGGVLWDYLQYVVGLARLGHDVYYFEDTWQWPYQPAERRFTNDHSYSVGAIRDFISRYEPTLIDSWRYVHLHDRAFGIGDTRWREIAASADLFINVSGASMLPQELGAQTRRVFVDTDPGYNQIMLVEPPAWAANAERWRRTVLDHDSFFTYAENIGAPDCLVPDVGLNWQTTRMPVVLDLWRELPDPDADRPWTTVMTWNAFGGELTFGGRQFRSKDAGFERILTLPGKVTGDFAVALGGREAPADVLRASGWHVLDGPAVTLTPELYQLFIAGSGAEISPAKEIYVAMRTGWFSCRSACYLAAGRPVVVEDTGWSHALPTGRGLLGFSTVDEAADAIRVVGGDLPGHRRAAAELAEEFDSAAVLQSLIERAMRPDRGESTITGGVG